MKLKKPSSGKRANHPWGFKIQSRKLKLNQPDICGTSGSSQQFEPTEACPIPQHQRMNGVS